MSPPKETVLRITNVFRHRLPEAALKLAARATRCTPIRASINCFRNSEHASTARPEGVLSLAASDFAPGQTRRVDKRSKSLSCPPRAKQPFIARWLGRVKPTDGGCALPLLGWVKVSFF